MPKPESIINSQIYPNLSHEIVFGDLPGFKSSGKPGAFVARCPNPEHKDKTPSFLMPPGKPYGFCKSCGYKPNWFYYIKKRDNLTDAETFKKLANMAGVELKSNISPEEWKNIKKARDKKEVRNEIYKEARDYFKHLLKSHPEAAKARSYLKDRNINPSDYNQFDLGYYPTRAEVEQYLLSKNFRSDEIITSGILVDYYERTHKVIFFYQNLSGDYEWIKARRIDKIKEAKTLPQSGFPASKVLYNIYTAKPEIQKKRWALVVEGEIDCKRVEKIGIKNVVSTSSANLSADQLKLLKQTGCERVIINFDGDRAGREGTIRALKEMKKLALIGYAFVIPGDPDIFILKYGGEKYLKYLKESERDFIFVLKYLVSQYDLSFSVEKGKCFDEAMMDMELFTIKSLYEKDLLSRYINQLFGLKVMI